MHASVEDSMARHPHLQKRVTKERQKEKRERKAARKAAAALKKNQADSSERRQKEDATIQCTRSNT
jgi:hypothetical protein